MCPNHFWDGRWRVFAIGASGRNSCLGFTPQSQGPCAIASLDWLVLKSLCNPSTYSTWKIRGFFGSLPLLWSFDPLVDWFLEMRRRFSLKTIWEVDLNASVSLLWQGRACKVFHPLRCGVRLQTLDGRPFYQQKSSKKVLICDLKGLEENWRAIKSIKWTILMEYLHRYGFIFSYQARLFDFWIWNVVVCGHVWGHTC